MCSPGHVSKFQWNWKCVFFRHVKMNSRFDVMTINVIPFDRPKIVTRFSIIRDFVCCSRRVRTSSKVSTELFASYRLGPALKWIFGFHDLFSNSFTVPSAIGNVKFSPFLGVVTSFALNLRAWISDAFEISSSSMSATKMCPFRTHPA